MTTGTETVERLLQEALMKTSHPEPTCSRWRRMCWTRGRRSRYRRGGPQVSKPEAFAAATAVTRMMRRHGLIPSDVCRMRASPTSRPGTSSFHLTQGRWTRPGR